MKNYSRAYNRHKKDVKFKRRVDIWFKRGSDNGENRDLKKLTLQGKFCKFLKTTSRFCDRPCCQKEKYKRDPKNKRLN